MAEIKYTEAQKEAIGSRGNSLLLSAAAGSGKTFVLTQRLMAYVTDPDEPKDIDSFLIITFTKAAAAELKSRISAQLSALAAEDPSNSRLRRQQNLCYRAAIGTIHSFCGDIVRRNCHALGISPAFSVIEDDRAAAIRESVMEKLLEDRYEQGAPEFLALADTLGAGRDDRRLGETVMELYKKLCSHPYPEDWAKAQEEAFLCSGISSVSESLWGAYIMESLSQKALFQARRMESACDAMELSDEKIVKAYCPSFAASAQALRSFYDRLKNGSWESAAAALPIPFERLGSLRNYDDPELADLVKLIRDECKKACADFAAVMSQSSESLIEQLRRCAPAMKELLELTMDFSKAYSAEKRRQNCLDFSDLEHFALELLVDKESGGPTAAALELSRHYTEIMIDEYQDVNAIQDMIFRAVSKSCRNLFMVGDVKQSIYRFRMADPSIFLARYEQYSRANDEGKRVLLQENFRSRRCVLEAANHVFKSIMSPRLGGLDYDDEAALKFGAQNYDSRQDCPAEFCIIDAESAADDEATPKKAMLEAEYVAARIRQMVDSGTPVYEKGVARPCRWSDFAILMRSPSGNGGFFHRALAKAGIPVLSRQGGDFFASAEISLCLDMLTVIDNPHDDVALVSVLRSPIFGFSPDELAEIRSMDKSGDFYSALRLHGESCEKSAAFLEKLGKLRSLRPDMGIDELLWQLFSELELFALCSAMPDGDRRKMNLMELFEYSGRFQLSGQHGLYRFINWLRRFARQGSELSTAGSGEAVQIMSIHKSKGLEFPFVFLCDLAKRFNLKDSQKAVLIHDKLGLGPKFTDYERGVEYPTIAHKAVAQAIKDDSLSEEMRVLYVAMTRAKERLIMSCVWKEPQRVLDKLARQNEAPMDPEFLMGLGTFSHWIAASALSAPELIGINICSAAAAKAENIAESESPEQKEMLSAKDGFERELNFVYPHRAAEALPTKLTATGIKDAERSEEDAELVKEHFPLVFRKPALGMSSKLSAAEKGTAAHAFLQFARLESLSSRESVIEEAARLARSGYISAEQAEALDIQSLLRFGQSNIFRRMSSAPQLRREFRFTLLVRAEDYFEGGGDDELLLQGVIDSFIIEPDGICIVDYKTDSISEQELESRAAHYAPQLQTYAKALERIMGLPVKECVLYFLRLGREWPISVKKE